MTLLDLYKVTKDDQKIRIYNGPEAWARGESRIYNISQMALELMDRQIVRIYPGDTAYIDVVVYPDIEW